jgi:hypothetical protein
MVAKKVEEKKVERVLVGYSRNVITYVGRQDRSSLIIYIKGIKTSIDVNTLYKVGTPVFEYLEKNQDFKVKNFIPRFEVKNEEVTK